MAVSRICDYYFDDTACGITWDEKIAPSEQQIATRMGKLVQDFEELLHLSGGGISFKKFFWYPIHWQWKEGNPTLKEFTGTTEITVLNRETKTLTNLKRKNPPEAHRTLGTFIAPSGN